MSIGADWPLSIMATQDVACGARLWRTAGQLRVTLACKATFSMVESGPMRVVAPAPIVVADEHAGGDGAKSVLIASDLVPYRPRGEVVFVGHAHAPNGSPCPSLTARLAVIGQRPYIDKSIHVFGERVVLADGQFSAPVPFTRMPIVYERSVQHPDENPCGMAAQTGSPAPNLVDPQDAASPTSLGPIAASWPVRRRMLRQLDPGVVESPVPEIPDAFAWSYFQAAPPDQRCPFFEGNEWLVLDGLHPDRAHFETQLPFVRAAARLYQAAPGESLGDAPFREFPLTADTLFVDGDRGLVCLLWRGNLDIDQAQLASMQVLAGLEVGGRTVPWPQSSMRPPPPQSQRASSPEPSGQYSVSAPTGSHASGSYPAISQPAPSQSVAAQPAAAVPQMSVSPAAHTGLPVMPPASQGAPSSVAFSSMPTPQLPSIVPSEAMTHRRPEAPTAKSPTTMEVQAEWLEPPVPEAGQATRVAQVSSSLKATMPVTDLQALLREATPSSRSPGNVQKPPSSPSSPRIEVLSAPPPAGEVTGPHPAEWGAGEPAHARVAMPAQEDAPQSLNPTTMRRPKFDDPETFQPDSASLAEIVHNAELAIGRRKESVAPTPAPAVPLVARKMTPGPTPIQRTPTPPPMSISQDPANLAAQARARAAEAAAQGAAAARQHMAAANANAMRKVRPPKTTIRGLGDPTRRPSHEPHFTDEADAFGESAMAGGVNFLEESTTGGDDVQAAIAQILPETRMRPEVDEEAPATRASLGLNLPPPTEPPGPDPDDGGGATRIAHGVDPALLAALRPPGLGVPGGAEAPAPDEQKTPSPPAIVDARAEVQRRMASGETLAGMSLEGVDLSTLDLSRCNLSGARLKGASLRSATLLGVDLSAAQLDGADLTHAKLDGANLERASLRAAILSDASLRTARITDADFEGAIGTSASFDEVTGDRVRFVGARFDCARFDRAVLEAADFSEAIVDGASFVGARLVEARLYEIRGESVTFTGATLTGARLDTSVLARAQFQNIDAADSLWDQAEIDQASFVGAKLAGASFIKASCREAVFEGADLADARFNRSILWGARFTNAKAEGVNFDGADTRGAVLPTSTA
ncbi:MAG: DUF2169 domain-containing protein [Polyangiaceae bacterium]